MSRIFKFIRSLFHMKLAHVTIYDPQKLDYMEMSLHDERLRILRGELYMSGGKNGQERIHILKAPASTSGHAGCGAKSGEAS